MCLLCSSHFLSIVTVTIVYPLLSYHPGFLCPLSANVYGIDFLSFTIKDVESNKVIFEVAKDPNAPPPQFPPGFDYDQVSPHVNVAVAYCYLLGIGLLFVSRARNLSFNYTSVQLARLYLVFILLHFLIPSCSSALFRTSSPAASLTFLQSAPSKSLSHTRSISNGDITLAFLLSLHDLFPFPFPLILSASPLLFDTYRNHLLFSNHPLLLIIRLVFKVGSRPVSNFRMIERHYYKQTVRNDDERLLITDTSNDCILRFFLTDESTSSIVN